MTMDEFRTSLRLEAPPNELNAPLASLWWDARGDWTRAHGLVDELETREGMAVHAYLHRKEGSEGNANYWYERAGRGFRRASFEEEWTALAEALLGGHCF
jgi:hypothetical protein